MALTGEAGGTGAQKVTPPPGRAEHDLLGERVVPTDAYWGIHTLRARENFPVSGVPVGRYPTLVRALAAVKHAAALANQEAGVLGVEVAEPVVRACTEIVGGALHDQFVVDVLQGGAGTSTNMNANEVIANRALELRGLPRGRYDVVHPVEHVNKGQSTNDVYPTAVKLALLDALDDLHAGTTVLSGALRERATAFADVLKIGRTQLQEAVPMTLGQEFAAFASGVEGEWERVARTRADLQVVHLGGTAIGTGLTAPQRYRDRVVPLLAHVTGRDLTVSEDRVAATSDTGPFVAVSGALRGLAVRLSKIASDLRLLASGPRAGLAEIGLPAVQAGSSVMPGKVNPVIPEMVNQVAFAVVGRDVTVSMAAEAGQLQLNAFEPLIVTSLLDSISQLAAACRLLAERCVMGVTADPAPLRRSVERSVGLVTALLPLLGYERATELAARSGQDEDVLAALEAGGLLPPQWQDVVLGREQGLAAGPA